ncbi:Mpv17 / PMP22 family [Seminavis robusta]|uniref:Mpv17 / PMP22 family n=1 Tax=Seminavis robusta TaxID=568900 RepID=A0A9N8F2Y1_9STRA|nr:Mpv17 / PMP22 family [Seminavis robusta]|eukprot:Sro2516_g329920.1 Mpv17 / PMP22 family (274) ;mRNA; r:3145-3966
MMSMYRSSSLLLATASRRVYHSTAKSLKASVDTTTTTKAKVVTEAAVEKTSGGIASFPKEHPFAFQLMVATGKTSAADLVCQVVAERKSWNEIDWKRNGIFVVFGFVYLGGFQYWLMVNKYRQWFPTMDRFAKLPFAEKLKDTAGILDAMKMVLFDVTVHLPIIYFPSYYAVKEFVGGHSWNPADWVKDGVTKYSRNMKEDLTAMIQLWGPSDCIQFVLPMHIRMPFRHLVSFFWTAYVSFTRGAIEVDEEVVVVAAVVEPQEPEKATVQAAQ